VAVAYIDFAQTFSTMCYSKLLNKLSAYGINGNLLQWVESFRVFYVLFLMLLIFPAASFRVAC